MQEMPIRKSEVFMKKKYLKSSDDKMYKSTSYEEKKVLKARHRLIESKKKKPTSVALDEETIGELKMLAEEKGIPYQVLMRSYILRGIKEEKAA